MKILATNSNLSLSIAASSTHFTNLATSISAGSSQGYFTVSGTDGVFTCKNNAVSSAAYVFANFNTGASIPRDGKTYYICFEIEMVSNSGASAAAQCITKFNGTSPYGTMTYPTTGRDVIGAEVTVPSSSDANLSQIILQHGRQLAGGTSEGAVEFKIYNIAIIDKSDCSFTSLNTCINHLKNNGFSSVTAE